MKYFVMTQPEPSQKSLERQVTERLQEVRERALASSDFWVANRGWQ